MEDAQPFLKMRFCWFNPPCLCERETTMKTQQASHRNDTEKLAALLHQTRQYKLLQNYFIVIW